MTLIWQPDPERDGTNPDPAENLWKEIESRLNKRRPTTAKRGQWVLTTRIPAPASTAVVVPLSVPVTVSSPSRATSDYAHAEGSESAWSNVYKRDGSGYEDAAIRGWEGEVEEGEGIVMERAESEFTVSAYFDPDLTTPRPPSFTYHMKHETEKEGIAIFDMSAPLIQSASRESATPANTSRIRPETIRRAPRVGGHSTKGSSSYMSLALSGSHSRSDSYERSRSKPSQSRTDSSESSSLRSIAESEDSGAGIYRLDSHVIAALQALGRVTPGPALDMALEASSSSSSESALDSASISASTSGSGSYATARTATSDTRSDSTTTSAGLEDHHDTTEVTGGLGLGIGMHIRLDSIYSLIAHTTPRLRGRTPQSPATGTDDSYQSQHVRDSQYEAEVSTRDGREDREKGLGKRGSLVVTDLDTGHKLDFSLSRLDEMTYL